MTPREERKARNVYNESLRRAQAGDPSSYVQGEMQRYGISDPSTTPFRGSGTGDLNRGIDTGKKYLSGMIGGAQRGLDALTQGVAMSNENTRWFQENAPNAQRYAGVPMGVRESVQTGRDEAFEKKYLNLAAMAQDSDKKQWYINQADTARRNLQITKRINYGMGQLGLDETPFEGYESYDPGFEGFGPKDLGPRFDIDRFSEAMSEYLPQEPQEPGDWGEMPDPFFMEREWEAPYAGTEDVTITDLMGPDPIYMPDEVEDITETITEDDFVLKEAEFSQGNLGTEGKYDYSPNLDLNIMNIKDAELRKKATDAAIQFNNVWLEGEDGEYYGQLEDLYQEYMDAVKAGAQ